MKSRTSIRILKLLLGLVFSVLIVYHAVVYFTCKMALSLNSPITYSIKEKKEHKGRGGYNTLAIVYKDNTYEVDITYSTYSALDKQEYPILFYNHQLDIVFDKWKLIQAKRIMIVGVIMLLFIAFLIKGQNANTTNTAQLI